MSLTQPVECSLISPHLKVTNMSIMRFSKGRKNPYFQMHNATVNNKKLSLKAKGLLAYLVSKPDHWYVNYHDLVSSSTDGIKSVRSTIKELMTTGYLVRSQIRKENGQFGYYDFTIYEKPQIPKLNKIKFPPYNRKRHTVKGHAEKGTLVITDKKDNTDNNNNTPPNDTYSELPHDVASYTKEEIKELINLLSELGILNHKKLFSTFNISDIYKYSTWIKTRKFKMKNPTGFLTAAIKEHWMDYEPLNIRRRTVIYWIVCPNCKDECGYELIPGTTTNCRMCKKLIPKNHYQRI